MKQTDDQTVAITQTHPQARPPLMRLIFGMMLCVSLFFGMGLVYQTAWAEANKVNLSPLFIELSDAMAAQKSGDEANARTAITHIQSQFEQITAHTSPAGQRVSAALQTATQDPNGDNLAQVSKALLAFENEQNPVDYSAGRAKFAKNVMPAYDKLNQALHQTDWANQEGVESAKNAYRSFNLTWTANERVVRDTSLGHYGKVETAMALLRTGIESDPPNQAQIDKQLITLKTALDSYNAGEEAQVATQGNYDLAYGVDLLKMGLSAFESGDLATGQDKLTTFIEIWPVIEGDVRTRNPSLYNRVESQVPIVMAKGDDYKNQQTLQGLIDELAQINPKASYSAIDAMLILLREGLEALLIVMALISALKAANQPKGEKWIWGGVALGLSASVLTALALQQFFPAVSSGRNREVLEGFVGIFAVVMMIGIGLWLHSKSSVANWQKFIKKHTGAAVATGSFLPMFGLSFLSVFREGAETILFYVGILPQISTGQFLLGIGMAIAILLVVAVIMLKTSLRLPIPTMFKILTALIYFLGFKMLGVSLHALQLTGYLPTAIIDGLPSIEFLGIYPTWQTLSMQLLYIIVIVALQIWLKKRETPKTAPQATA